MQMTIQHILFIIFGAVTLGAGLMVVTRRNVFHAALFLILSFFGVAGLYVLLEAPFLAGVQLFIYAGGIAILIIFAIMLTRDMMNPDVLGANRQWWAAALVAVALCGVLVWAVLNHGWGAAPGPVPRSTRYCSKMAGPWACAPLPAKRSGRPRSSRRSAPARR